MALLLLTMASHPTRKAIAMSKRIPITDPIQESDPYPYFEMIVAANPHELEPGVIFDHGIRTVEELARDVIKYAIERGYTDSDAAILVDNVGENVGENPLPEEWRVMGYGPDDYGMALDDAAFDATGSATEYLQQLAPEGFWVGSHEGAYGVWRITDIGEE